MFLQCLSAEPQVNVPLSCRAGLILTVLGCSNTPEAIKELIAWLGLLCESKSKSSVNLTVQTPLADLQARSVALI